MSKFKKGEEVICSHAGKGIITDYDTHGYHLYPITVTFSDEIHDTYTKDGHCYTEDEQEPHDPYIRKLTKLDKALK